MKKYIFLVLIIFWMITVFSFSNQNSVKSSGVSGKVTRKVITVLKITEGLNEQEKDIVQNNMERLVRKTAHYSIYTIGGILFYLEFNSFIKISTKFKVLLTQICGSLYACTDEFHQFFVPGRSSEIRDVIIDSFGVFTGIILTIILLIVLDRMREIRTIKRLSSKM